MLNNNYKRIWHRIGKKDLDIEFRLPKMELFNIILFCIILSLSIPQLYHILDIECWHKYYKKFHVERKNLKIEFLLNRISQHEGFPIMES